MKFVLVEEYDTSIIKNKVDNFLYKLDKSRDGDVKKYGIHSDIQDWGNHFVIEIVGTNPIDNGDVSIYSSRFLTDVNDSLLGVIERAVDDTISVFQAYETNKGRRKS